MVPVCAGGKFSVAVHTLKRTTDSIPWERCNQRQVLNSDRCWLIIEYQWWQQKHGHGPSGFAKI